MVRNASIALFLNIFLLNKNNYKYDLPSQDDRHRLLRIVTDTNVEYYPLRHPKKPDSTALPPKEFKPKQSLGQNFLNDINILKKLCYHLTIKKDRVSIDDDSQLEADNSGHVVELGAGTGSLTKILFEKFPNMTAIEIDARAICMLSRNVPGLDMIHDDVLQADFTSISKCVGKKLWIIGNLPFYITTQIFFCLLDHRNCIDRAVLVTQKEVADRLVARPGDKIYSKLSVIMQLYTSSRILFDIPNHVFFPVPKVSVSAVRIDFNDQPLEIKCSPLLLKRVIFDAFSMKKKFLKSSLAGLMKQLCITKLPDEYERKRGFTTSPEEFVKLSEWLQENGMLTQLDDDIMKEMQLISAHGHKKGRPPKKREKTPILDVDVNFGKVWRKTNHGEDVIL